MTVSKMFNNLFKKTQSDTIPQQLYGTVMTQARNPVFFTDLGFEDDVMGRYDVLSMHVYLLARRLKAEKNEKSHALSQDIFDLFIEDIDRGLRQLGVGDTTVPKRKKRMLHRFYAQIEDFDDLMAKEDADNLSVKLKKRYFEDKPLILTKALSAYMLDQAKNLDEQSIDDFYIGKISWEEPQP